MSLRAERKKILRIFNALILLSKSRTKKVLVRSFNLAPYGLITKREYLVDTSIGESRDWVSGKTFGTNEIFREPLDWINPRTQDLESCKLIENNYFIITARMTEDISDDPENFQWFARHDQMNAWHDLETDIQMKGQMLMNAQNKIKSIMDEKDSYRKMADLLGSENRNLKAQNERLVHQVSHLNDQINNALVMAHKKREDLIEQQSAMNQSILSASERGKMLSMTPSELTRKALEERNKEHELMFAFNRDTVYEDKIRELDGRMAQLESMKQPPPMERQQKKKESSEEEGGGIL